MGTCALVFDMDGTLLDTMPDLAVAANEALSRMGFPVRTQDEMLGYMGLGGRWFIEQIVPKGASASQRNQMFDLWRNIYIASSYELSAPFEGMAGTLRELRDRGVKTAILSNKFDEGVRVLAGRHFAGLFDVVRGDSPPTPRKPDPTSLLQVVEELGVGIDEAAYVGDSMVDVNTAKNAGMRFVGVAWGYDRASPLPLSKIHAYMQIPEELLSLIAG